MNNKVVAVISGGLDSTTMLHQLKAKGKEIYALSFDYSQKHSVQELNCAEYWGEKLCKEWKLINLDFMKEIAGNSALLNNNPIPHGHYAEENQKQTVVPFRNGVMLAIAVAWAENIGADAVYFGAHAGDFTIYPDCRKTFVAAINTAAKQGTYNKVKIKAPFSKINKTQIVTLGNKLGVDFSKTWSCYEGKEKHCGLCGSCSERRESFKQANVTDPTEYEAR